MIQSATVIRELEVSVQYVFDKAEPDVGAAADVEILSARIGNVDIPLTKEQYDSIRYELRDAEVEQY